ncbi:ABC transporter ATP-binding protein [Candidatus Saccharibacteria bacterium]|jgi:polysaccharide ABC exporter ATP-binding protein|nr:ABC transporter ATP-binding protein [Candidatus Saccharibacteria bacterium]
MNKKVAIRVDNLVKTFKIPTEASNGIKQKLINVLKGKKGYREFTPLKGISFEIEKGEFFGIVGRNGSGKSTLLKTIAGIYQPNQGSVEVNGRLVPFIELGVGFNHELTGRENIYLNGALLGFSNQEVDAMYDEIVAFAELEDFMEEKLKNYSSGMQVRLAFSIAIRAKSDILLLDEVLAVGDEAFQRKCENYFRQLRKQKKTVILVTHSMGNVRKYCSRAMLIRDGKIVSCGNPDDVANEYSIENLYKKDKNTSAVDEAESNKKSRIANLAIKLTPAEIISQTDYLDINVKYDVLDGTPTHTNISLQDINRNAPILASQSKLTKDKKVSVKLRVKLAELNDTDIRISVTVRDKDSNVIHFLPDEKSPIILLRRTDYSNKAKRRTWATLFDRGEWL